MNPSGYISRVFGQSPVRPLQEHIEKAAACAQQLPEFVRAAQAGDWTGAGEVRKSIVRLEHEADDLKRDLRLNLPRTLFMPVARTDVLEMLSVQDRIANKARDISGLMLGRRMTFPQALQDTYLAFADRCLDAVLQAHKTVNELDELFETGFRGSEIELVMGMIKELDRVENDSDSLQVELRARLFEIERDLPPIDVMFLYKIIDWTGDLGDLAQRVGSRLHLMIAR
ncbi:TIGR00153 family protein [Wenzhouxiangella sp. XN201]|uniref:TIGR00153 family protein n=1 Tax=Wenzhouxiangella sp. XN201 TaxID=2710755 RepID=UPI0013C985B1|nr:TIGR00153 family protein [Wenzhouxiangella sp. XN201]NEZ05160.1 TIGR00153 family protein [Wenzhouxiangella sp. XN201]